MPKHASTKKPGKSAVKAKQTASKTTTHVKQESAVKTKDLPTAAVVRIAKASGAERVGSDGAAALVTMAEDYLSKLVKEANKLASHAGRKTIKEEDVEMAAEKTA